MTRRIAFSDVPRVLPLAKRCYDEMNFDEWGYRYEPERIEESWKISVMGEFLRGYVHGNIDGLMMFQLTSSTPYFRNGPQLAQEIVFHADPDLSATRRTRIMLNMLDYAIADLHGIGVNSIYINDDARYGGVSKILVSRGFKPMSTAHYLGV